MKQEERQQIVRAALASAKLRAGWWRARCPFCEGRDDSFSINAITGFYHCFRCPKKGVLDSDDENIAALHLPPDEAAKAASDMEAIRHPPDGFFLLAGDTSYTLAPARDYLHSRGIPERVWHEAQVGACAHGKYAGRVVIPNLLDDGSWYGYTTRVWGKPIDKKMKYRYPPGGWRGAIMHNQPALHGPSDEHLYIVEGAFDALFLWPHAVAVLGMPSEHQITMLAASKRPLVAVLDADAWEKGWALAMRLRLEGCTAGAVKLMDGADPDEVDPAWLWEEARASLVD